MDEEFAAWLQRVDDYLHTKHLIVHTDLADMPWRDWFDDGLDPEDAAEEALESDDIPWNG